MKLNPFRPLLMLMLSVGVVACGAPSTQEVMSTGPKNGQYAAAVRVDEVQRYIAAQVAEQDRLAYLAHVEKQRLEELEATRRAQVQRARTVRAASARPAPSGDIWWRLFGCETGYTYNPAIVSKTGKFRGAFQFDIPTWQSVGGTGDPAAAPYEEQLMRAKMLVDRAGGRFTAFPHCRRVLGLP